MGHFRSTIIGNFVSNLMSSVGHDVVKINYLGDWGTQFGLLELGLQLKEVTEAQIATDPIRVLYECYVFGNEQAKDNPELQARAREIFRQMEEGAEIERWHQIRQHTTDELRKTYLRLGVTFDEYQWESMFGAKQISDVLKQLETEGHLQTLPDGECKRNYVVFRIWR